MLYFYEETNQTGVRAWTKAANYAKANLVLIGPQKFDGVACFTWDEFTAKLGGPVLTWDVFDEKYAENLVTLGYNRLPDGLTGKPDNLFENMVKAGLRFVLANRTVQFGQERLFEKLPDGVAFLDARTPLLYDCKAYTKGFEISADDIRRFADYVAGFNRKYTGYFDSIHSFLVVTGEMADSIRSVRLRAAELRAACNTQLVLLEAAELGGIVRLLSEHPIARRSLNWRLLMSDTVLTERAVREDLQRVLKDGLLEG